MKTERASVPFLFSCVSQGNKGGLSIRMSFYGHTLCFLNCHLTAHMQYATERVDEFEYIVDTQTFDCEKTPKILDHGWVDTQDRASLCWLFIYRSSAFCCFLAIQAGVLVWRSQFPNSGPRHSLCAHLHQHSKLQPAMEQRPGVTLDRIIQHNDPGSAQHSNQPCNHLYDTCMLPSTVEHDEEQRRDAAAVWGRTSGLSAHVQVWLKHG